MQVKGGVGKAVKHLCADIQCTGEATYVDDIPNPAGGLYAGLVLSQKPRARLLSVDPAPALAMPGVRGFFDYRVRGERGREGGKKGEREGGSE